MIPSTDSLMMGSSDDSTMDAKKREASSRSAFSFSIALLKPSVFGGGQEHEVMGEDAEQAFPLAGLVRAAPQGGPEQPLVPAEHALRLPPLAVHPPVAAAPGLLPEPPHHLPA